MQAQLGPRAVLLEYVLGEARSHAWLVTSSRHVTFEVPGRPELDRLARQALAALTPPANSADAESTGKDPTDVSGRDAAFRRASRALSASLLGPAAAAIRGRSQVLVVADGVLQSLPFAALPMPGKPEAPLGSTHEVVMLPSASVGAALRARASSQGTPGAKIAVLADPVFSPDDTRLDTRYRVSPDANSPRLPRLRFSRAEADRIASLAPARTTIWSDFDASRRTALDPSLTGYDVIHFATHAVIDEQHPQLSGIVLSHVDRQGRPQNGLVRLHEVYNLSLRAQLVVLSACRTALGRPVEGEGLIGLARGFLHAGGAAVIATLWAVDDRATAAFMDRFYEALLNRNLSPSAALRWARRSMLRDPRWSRPQDWAGFVLIGDVGS